MFRREALNLALRLDKARVKFDRVYSWNQGATEDSWFISSPTVEGNTIRSKEEAKPLLYTENVRVTEPEGG